jgi:hypothetical protein
LFEYAFKLATAITEECCELPGAVGCSQKAFQGLEVKHIQLDTLGHLVSRHVITCGHFASASTVLGNTLKFFTGNYKDVRALATHAFVPL